MSLAPQQVLRSDHINQILRALREATAVLSGLEVVPTSPPSMSVVVRAGSAVINGRVVALDRDVTVAVPAANPDNPRFDLVTLKSDGTVGYYAGTPEPPVCLDANRPETCVRPVPPRTPAGEVALAEVWVPAGARAVDRIVDRRVIVGLPAQYITSGRLSMSRLPDGETGKVLVAQGIGRDPAWADPDFNLIAIGGTAVTPRDWSQDFAKLQNLDIALSALRAALTTSTIGSTTYTASLADVWYYLTLIKAKTDNIDVALSTRASEATLAAIRDRLPASLTPAGNLRAAILEDTVGLARDSTVAAVRDRLPASLTSAGNFKVAVVEDALGLARDSTAQQAVSALGTANMIRYGAGLGASLSVPSGYVLTVPPGVQLDVPGELFADGDTFIEGSLLVA